MFQDFNETIDMQIEQTDFQEQLIDKEYSFINTIIAEDLKDPRVDIHLKAKRIFDSVVVTVILTRSNKKIISGDEFDTVLSNYSFKQAWETFVKCLTKVMKKGYAEANKTINLNSIKEEDFKIILVFK